VEGHSGSESRIPHEFDYRGMSDNDRIDVLGSDQTMLCIGHCCMFSSSLAGWNLIESFRRDCYAG
jgi:hypothetical protein